MKYRRTKEEERGTEIRGTIYFANAARAQGLPKFSLHTHGLAHDDPLATSATAGRAKRAAEVSEQRQLAGKSPCASGVGLQTSKYRRLLARQLLFIG